MLDSDCFAKAGWDLRLQAYQAHLRWSGQEVGVVCCGCVRKWVWFRFAVGYMFYSNSRYCP